MEPVDVFTYLAYRPFLADFVAWKKAQRGLTFRALAQRSGINSPNYLQQVIAGNRNLTAATAAKVATGLGLTAAEKKYFLSLVELEQAKTDARRQEVLDDLKAHLAKARKVPLKTPSIHAHWLHSLIWESAALEGADMSPSALAKRFRNVAAEDEIKSSLAFLEKQGWLENGKQKPIAFEPLNDVRRVEIQQCHLKYLELAKRRLIDPLDEREFQALTLAIPRGRMAEVKKAMRALVIDLNEKFSGLPGADAVLQIECAAFFADLPVDDSPSS